MGDESGPFPPGVDPGRPCTARVFDFLLGGCVNFEGDRQAARRLVEVLPDLPAVLRVNRAFVTRVVRFLAGAGMRQFLDVGSGVAGAGAVHQVAREAGVDARVLYVDSDPVVVAHNRLLVPEGCAVLRADPCDVAGVLASSEARRVFDSGVPVAVLMIAVLHSVAHTTRPGDIVARYRDALPAGSCLAFTHAEGTGRAASTFHAARVYSREIAPIHLRTRTEIAALVSGWDLLAPGLAPTADWQPGATVAPWVSGGLSGVGAVAFTPAGFLGGQGVSVRGLGQ